MEPITQTILDRYLVRKSAAHKQAFRDFLLPALAAEGIGARVETHKGLIRTDNVVIGDPATADFVVGAHYDTQAVLPFPNLLFPKNLLLTLLAQFFLVGMILLVIVLLQALLAILTDNSLLATLAGPVLMLAASFLMIAGPANRNTYNDNTSGVTTLLETLLALPPAQRSRVAFVLFDNEELGLVGSSAFARRHKAAMAGTPLINLDCVSDGDHLMLVSNPRLLRDKNFLAALQAAFGSAAAQTEKHVVYTTSRMTFYLSDQLSFPVNTAVAAFKRHRFFGYYMDRIHTARDTIFDVRNIELIRGALLTLAAHPKSEAES